MNYVFLKWGPTLPSVHTKLPLLQSWVILLEWIQKSQQSLHKYCVNLQLVPVYIKYAICTSCSRRMSSHCSLSLHTFSSMCGGILPYRMIGPLTQATNSDKVSTVFYMNPETTKATKHAEANDLLIFWESNRSKSSKFGLYCVISNNANLKST